MHASTEYRRRAEEAEQRARDAQTATEREAFGEIAEGWRRLAQEAQRRLARGY